MINISGLQKYYNKGKRNETYALRGLEISFEQTGLVCILGESGCGKTTFLNAIGGLDSFDNGTIEIDEETVTKYKMKQIESIRNERFGYVFQNYYLLNDQTVEENVMIALSMFDMSEEEKANRVEYTLHTLGLTKYKKKRVANLSGGQQQRVSIARALVKSPEIILADEPTGNLDEENTIKIMSILKTISKKCLVLLVTHEGEMAKLYADRIIEMVDGVVKADYKNKSTDVYTRSDDPNIYLGEYEEKKLENEYANISFYGAFGENPNQLKIKLVFNENKIYIKNESDYTLLFEGPESGFSILEGKAPKMTMETVCDVDFSLSDIKSKNKSVLPFKQLRCIARENRRALGKKQAFMVLMVLVATAMLTFVIADYVNKKYIDKTNIVTSDSHILEFSLSARQDEYEDFYFAKFDYCMKNCVPDEKYAVYPKISEGINLVCNNMYGQLQNARWSITGTSIAPRSALKESDLIYGRLPENVNEIVVDKLMFDKFLQESFLAQNLFKDVKHFLNQKLYIFSLLREMDIVGITDMKEPSVFVDERLLLFYRATDFPYAPLSKLKEAYPGKYDDLYDEEVLFSQKEFDRLIQEGKVFYGNYVNYGYGENFYSLDIKDFFKDDFEFPVIVSDEMYKQLNAGAFSNAGKFYVYVYDLDDMEAVKKRFLNTMDCTVEVKYKYQEEMDEYYESIRRESAARTIVTILVFALSIIVVFVSMKLNIAARKEQIIIYRLIGINPGSIIKSFIMEMGGLTISVCVPTILVTSLVLNLISSIKALGLNFYFSWWIMLVLAFVMVATNVLVCFISVSGMLKKPPVQIR